jgi:hypothetical protein
MASLIKRTAVICDDVVEFDELTRFRHKEGVEEYIHVTTVDVLKSIDILTNVIYLGSATKLDEFAALRAAVSERGVSERWQ